MTYPTLEKIMYANPSSNRFSERERVLNARLENESTFRTGIQLEQGELFLAVPRELSVVTELVLRRERRVSALWRELPPVALGAYIRSLIMDEVVYSNEIEGVRSTRREIEEALDRARDSAATNASKHHTPFQEFADLYLQLTSNPPMPTSLADIRSIYDSVVAGSIDPKNLPGEALFRMGPVEIINERGKTVHKGVVPESAIETMMQQWLDLSLSEEIPELYSALLCHLLFGYIHPFYDGNGRTGRYLLALHLSKPLSQATVLSLSRTIAENKAAYYKAFGTVERPLNGAEGTHFVLSMLDLVSQAQEGLITDLESKKKSIEGLEGRIEALDNSFSARDKNVLFYAAQMYLYNVLQDVRANALVDHLGVSKPTLRKTLGDLSEGRGLMERTSARPAIYRLTQSGLELLGLE